MNLIDILIYSCIFKLHHGIIFIFASVFKLNKSTKNSEEENTSKVSKRSCSCIIINIKVCSSNITL
jgi:hypothetical protein